MRMTKHAIQGRYVLHVAEFCALITALVIPGLALAGSSDIGLFAGSGAVPPNIHLLIDNSGSMDRDVNGVSPCVLPCESRRYIATNAIQTFVDEVNPVVAGVREENARLGLSTYRSQGSTVEVPLGIGTSDAVKAAVAALVSLGVGTPIAGSILELSGGALAIEDFGEGMEFILMFPAPEARRAVRLRVNPVKDSSHVDDDRSEPGSG